MWLVATAAWGVSLVAMGARLSHLFPSELKGWSLLWSAHFCALLITVPMSLRSGHARRTALSTMFAFTVASLYVSYRHICCGYGDMWIVGVLFESYIGAAGVLVLAGLSYAWQRWSRRLYS
jgi:hypothetical protein